MTHDLSTDAGIVDAVRDLLCDHGWGHEQAHGPPGLASEEIPGCVADVLAEVERLRARFAELEAERWPIPGTEGDEQYTARALLGRVVRVCAGRAKRYLRPRAKDRPALTVGEVTSLGSGYSAALCHAYGYDPDTGAELRPEMSDV
jgi:hypothetical protein